MNLYRVTCKGMTVQYAGNSVHGVVYVIADNSHDAYSQVRQYLDDNDLGFRYERCLDKVELLAENRTYPECGYRLFLPNTIFYQT